MLALWARGGPVDAWYEPLAVWREWAEQVAGRPVEGGHFLPEEAPDDVLRELVEFFAAGAGPR